MEEKIYFMPGDVVRLKLDVSNKPNAMLVMNKEMWQFRNGKLDTHSLRGIKCRWFTTDGKLLEAIWNTKDLEHIK